MCSIVASFDLGKLIELAKLNSYRGSLNWSRTEIHSNKTSMTYRFAGELVPDSLILTHGAYSIVHQQAPTTPNASILNIHPAAIGKDYLWHNGIIKQQEIARLQTLLGSGSTWDSNLLLHYLTTHDGDPSDIDGTFACMWYTYNGYLQVFRNELAPLFIDGDLNISSTKFQGSEMLEPNVMFEIDLDEKKLRRLYSFTTKETPYYFAE